VKLATSRQAFKAYLSTILFLAASLTLLAISTSAYLLFYYNFIPQAGLSKVIHLQYADGPFPHSTTYLSSSPSTTSSLKSLQAYDVTIHLHLPRTPTNLAAGNFMLELSLMSPPSVAEDHLPTASVSAPSNTTTPLARSRRPAILPYQSPITSLTNTFLSLPLHTLSLRDIDASSLSIPMFEQVTFARGRRNVPASARLEIQTQPHTQAALLGQSAELPQHVPLQVYSARIEFHARFRGLRWLMYNWRISSFLAFTSAFYCVALLSTGVAWGLVTVFWPSSPPSTGGGKGQGKIKNEGDIDSESKASNGHATRPIKTEPTDAQEEESEGESGLSLSNLSDHATTFPTLGRQMPLQYPIHSPVQYSSTTGSHRIKKEDRNSDKATAGIEESTTMEPLAPTTAGEFAEGEDEDEDLHGRDQDRDSGLGTSMEESSREATGLQRRRSGRSGGSGSTTNR
jgi:seipin